MWPTLQPGDQVTVEPAVVADLHAGDLVLLQSKEDVFLHRFLGFTHNGSLLTKGDGHRAPDTPWPPETLLGRATTLSRQGKTITFSSSSLREKARTARHRLTATAWSLLRRVGLLLLSLAIPTAIVSAAVTLTSFEASRIGDDVLITWETASHIGTSAFYLQRKHQEDDIYLRISPRINTKGDGMSPATYAYTDTNIEQGNTYYYLLEDVQDDGTSQFHGPISITIPFPTPTPPPPPPPVTPSPSPSPTPTPTPPTGTPLTSTPTRTPTPTASSGGGNTPTKTFTPTPTRAPTTTPPSAAATSIPEPDHTPSETATAPGSTAASQLAESTPAPSAQATSIAPATNSHPQPSSSPEPTLASLTHITTKQEPSFPWMLILLLIIAAGVLIFLGGWGIWRTRDKK